MTPATNAHHQLIQILHMKSNLDVVIITYQHYHHPLMFYNISSLAKRILDIYSCSNNSVLLNSRYLLQQSHLQCGVHSKNLPINYELLLYIHTPPSPNHFGQHLISYYDTKDYTILYANNHFTCEIDSASLKPANVNAVFSLEILKHKDTQPGLMQCFELYSTIRPTLILSQTYSGIFVHLFGVIFKKNNNI